MKKIIVAIALLLVATFALSVAAFGATEADFGAKTYYLGNTAKTAPKLDAEFGASEYALSYTLDKGVYVDADGEYLVEAADAEALTSAIKVGVSYDEEFVYIGFEAAIDADVATAKYVVVVNGSGYSVDADAAELEENVAFKQTADKAVGEIVFDLGNDDASAYNSDFTFYIVETTENAAGKTLNASLWNVVKLTSGQMFELGFGKNDDNFLTHTYVLGSEATLGEVVTVEQEPIGKPGDTIPTETKAPETTAPETTAPETTAPETTAPETKAPETKAPETKAPETKAPETTAPAEEEGGCGSSVTAMGIALVAALGTCAVVVSKKKED